MGFHWTFRSEGDGVAVEGIDDDGEFFDVSDVRLDEGKVSFVSTMPSTGRRVQHSLRISGPERIEQRYTVESVLERKHELAPVMGWTAWTDAAFDAVWRTKLAEQSPEVRGIDQEDGEADVIEDVRRTLDGFAFTSYLPSCGLRCEHVWIQRDEGILSRFTGIGEWHRRQGLTVILDGPRGRTLAVEDDGCVAYALLREGPRVLCWCWLYNCTHAPAEQTWSVAPRLEERHRNPEELCLFGFDELELPRSGQDFSAVWSDDGNRVELRLRDKQWATLDATEPLGRCVGALESGPLAFELE